MFIEEQIELLKSQVLIHSNKVKELELSLNLKQKETFLTTKQAAEMLGIPRGSFRQRRRQIRHV